ncbi:hypothetical protein FDH38_gp036 [Dinoroseobacter phage vB_DshS-R5C]|uniref:Uncharacterized protein n=1 Tax=Dinoroseobacter phage vB_DshS-R5C TaxID=1965368 RepID=A0A1V0DY83_9CAUD|nr:hypothetical protein FDH38_gp036 [Dinoroseobacter phage vB_DshS-R5C]ARB06090.1 hypothetical protein vBDshSR5C_36 [Dinoroseobacter phage vB_DshS-R5C]
MKADWSGLFNFKKGTELKVNVYDVTHIPDGNDMRFGHDGVTWIDANGECHSVERLELVETQF